MRFNGVLISICIFAFLTGAPLQAGTSKIRVGYVDMSRALNEVDEGKAAKAKLKKDFERKQSQLDKLQKEMKREKEEFDRKSAMMKPEVRAKQQDDLQRKFMEMQQTYMGLQRELMDQEGKITKGIGEKIRTIVARIGDRDSYDMILEINAAVLYHKRHQDITSDVVKAYNKQYAKK